MKCLSFNCRGLASTLKKLAMQRLIENDPIDILMLLETLGNVEDIEHTLAGLRPGWHH